MTRWQRLLCCVALATLFVPATALAKKIKIKLGTLAPKDSPWYNGVKRIGQDWKKQSGGKIKLKVYPGGVAGDEGDMIRKMRIGQLHAATITGVGLSRITRATIALQVPMMLHSYEELDYIRDKVGPKVEAELEKAGFIVLHWGDAGWAHFFSAKPAHTAADFKKTKLFMWAGDPESETAWRAANFTVVPMSATDVLSGLQTGLVESFTTTPLYALTSQWFGLAKNMVQVKWTPINGATVMTKKKFDSLDPELQKIVLTVAKEEGERMKGKIRELGDSATKAMVDRGLKIHVPTPEELAEWQKSAEMAYPAIRGKIIAEPLFDEVQGLVKAFRANKKKQ